MGEVWDTDFWDFLLGFVSAFVLAVVSLTAIYLGLKRSRNNTAAIKGYFDVIPDLTAEQQALVQEIRRPFLPRIGQIGENLHRERSLHSSFSPIRPAGTEFCGFQTDPPAQVGS